MPTVSLVLEYAQQTSGPAPLLAVFAGVLHDCHVADVGGLVPATAGVFFGCPIVCPVRRTAVWIHATATSGQVASLYDTRESELNSLLEVLRSALCWSESWKRSAPTIFEGAGSTTDVPAPAAKSQTSTESPSIADANPRAASPTGFGQAGENVSIAFPQNQHHLIGVQGRAAGAGPAGRGHACFRYMDEHLRVHHTAGSYEFFREQTQLLKHGGRRRSPKFGRPKTIGILTFEGKENTARTRLQISK